MFLQQEEPRILKSHLPVKFWRRQILDGRPKVIVVMRNPKDNLVSYFHFVNMVEPGCMTWQQWFDNFRLGHSLYGGWLNNVHDWWYQFSSSTNVLFLKYEDVKSDVSHTVDVIADFLNTPLTRQEKEIILKHTTFQNMRSNPATNLNKVSFLQQDRISFQRKGQVGDWKNYFTPEQDCFLENLCKEKLEKIGLTFQFE